ncbi:MAG TPA: DUF3857 domain-containing protein, partial [Chitinophagaceae bacterium]|nr:DUF3857 domain-containing protein [Chitinophagaceae bacterium]
NTTWADKPSMHEAHKPFDSSSAVGILDERKIEYRNEKDNLFIYEYDHRIIKIMNDNGIEMFNKIYIPVYANAEIQNIKARTILSDGKVIDISTDKIKEIEEDGETYKLFAMDGLEKGCEVEYAYTVKRNLSVFGSQVFQRRNVPYQQAKFTLITPSYLKFDAKGYNGFKVSKDSVVGEQRIIVGYSNNIDELEEEKYSNQDPYLQRVDYKLSYNISKNENVRLYTWKEFAKQSFTGYTNRTQKEEKALDAFIGKMQLPSNADDAARILAIEDYVKNNINIDKKLIADDADNIEHIVKNKAADDDGIVRLFAGIFDKLSINYQFVFPGTRTGFTIDEELENWNRANDVLIYFPTTGKYISPVSVDLRYPYIPFEFTAIRGLFLKGTVIGDFKTAIGSFNNVSIEPFDQHAINMEADIRFDETLDTILINSKQILRGYGATSYRPIYAFLPADKQEEANKEIIKAVAGSENISNIKIENPAFTNYFDNKPLVISADVKSTTLVERAGNKILLKVGDVIGPQAQMYQEKPRRLPVELPFPHVLDRKIILHIPGGYTVKNLNDINMNIEYKEDGETTMGFVSSYTQNSNEIIILVNETYRKIQYPLSQFEEFKNVINASADFNKVVLVLQKK